jgi:DNA invertase Pin-like site-specific DNA recombinase
MSPPPNLARIKESMPAMAKGSFVAYYRVSTAKQGASGLGLGPNAKPSSASSTKGTGASSPNSWRWRAAEGPPPELEKALAASCLHRAPLVVAKLDRLTRLVAFLSRLLEAGVEVRFCDLPEAEGPQGRFLLNSMVAAAELEAGLISQRTKAALQLIASSILDHFCSGVARASSW